MRENHCEKRREYLSSFRGPLMKNSLIIRFLLKNSPFFNSQLEAKPLGKFFLLILIWNSFPSINY